jgi:hypothetical protein
MDTADRRGTSGSRYRRPYAVPERLDLLQGPSSGTVHLPSHPDWSGNAVDDLDAPGRVVDLGRAVLVEAAISRAVNVASPKPPAQRETSGCQGTGSAGSVIGHNYDRSV